MRIGFVLVIVWLVIGAIAAGQRDYFDGTDKNCSDVGTIGLTVIAGPLNYVGVDPKISCEDPQPSSLDGG